jgi:Glycosyl hydrolase family 26
MARGSVTHASAVAGLLLATLASCAQSKPLIFIGQDSASIDNYANSMGGDVAGVTSYTGLRDQAGGSLLGLRSKTNYGAGDICAQCLLDKYPNAQLALGLDLVGVLDSINKGSHDSNLDDLADFLGQTGRTVYLRIGYESDMSHNGYASEPYRAAYRRIAKHIRDKRGLRNVKFVWQLGTSNLGTYQGQDVMSWWPGADVVDLVGGSYFVYHASSWDRLLSIGRKYNKPVMICESSPQGMDLGRLRIQVRKKL